MSLIIQLGVAVLKAPKTEVIIKWAHAHKININFLKLMLIIEIFKLWKLFTLLYLIHKGDYNGATHVFVNSESTFYDIL
jgi:hypothetical protein